MAKSYGILKAWGFVHDKKPQQTGKSLKILNTRQYIHVALYRIPAIEGLYFQRLAWLPTEIVIFCRVQRAWGNYFPACTLQSINE